MTAVFPPIVPVPEVARPAWRRLAHALEDYEPPCAIDSDCWYSTNADDLEAASRVCLTCRAFVACGEYADAANEKHGTWAGVDRTHHHKPPRPASTSHRAAARTDRGSESEGGEPGPSPSGFDLPALGAASHISRTTTQGATT